MKQMLVYFRSRFQEGFTLFEKHYIFYVIFDSQKKFFFDRQREKNKLKHTKTGDAPYVHRQYTKKVKPKAIKEGKKPRNDKVNQHSNHPTNS